MYLVEYGLRHAGNKFTDDAYPTVAELCFQMTYKLSMNPQKSVQHILDHAHEWVFGGGENGSQIGNTERILIR